SNSLEFLAPPFVSRQKVENNNISNVRIRKTGSDFTLLEIQATVKKNNTSSIEFHFVTIS
ncbi:MAG: hypothetical protein ACOYLG_13445, partial [Chitinophagaceae bacterium]